MIFRKEEIYWIGPNKNQETFRETSVIELNDTVTDIGLLSISHQHVSKSSSFPILFYTDEEMLENFINTQKRKEHV
jgi:hypothetical protein